MTFASREPNASPSSPKLSNRTRALLVAALVTSGSVAVNVAIPKSASAQAKNDAATKAAGARFDEGVRAYDKSDFEAARLAFLQAWTLRKHPTVLLNLGLSSTKSKHYAEGARYLSQYLREGSQSEEKKVEAERALADARSNLARVDVVAPPGTEIRSGGELLGTTPLKEALDLEPGQVALVGKLPDGTEQTVRVQGAAGSKTTIKFDAKTGPTEVKPTPAAPTPVPTTPTPTPTASEPTTPVAATPPTVADPGNGKTETTNKNTRSPVPAIVGFSVGAVGLGLGVAFVIGRSNAQSNATDVETAIKSALTTEGRPTQGACNNTTQAYAKYQQACSTLQGNLDKVNTNGTIATVSFIVGGIGLAAGIGGLVWYLLGNKSTTETTATAKAKNTWGLVPTFAPDSRGLTLFGTM